MDTKVNEKTRVVNGKVPGLSEVKITLIIAQKEIM